MKIYKCVNGMCGREETNKKNLRALRSGYPDVHIEHVCSICGSEIKETNNTKEEAEYQDNFEITEAMIRFGGSFVKVLGRLWRIGDDDNRRKLQDAFPEYWKRYTKIVKEQREACGGSERRWYDD